MKLAKAPSHPATDREGAITNGKKVPMVILAMLRSQGNGIAAEGVRPDPAGISQCGLDAADVEP